MTPDHSSSDFILYERPGQIVVYHNADAGATAINLNINAGEELYAFLTERPNEIHRLMDRLKAEPIGFQLGSDEDNPIVKQFFFITGIHPYAPAISNVSQEHQPEPEHNALVRLTTPRRQSIN
jgi:hypothetical protein